VTAVLTISDEELAAEALAARPEDVPDDAVPWTDVVDEPSDRLDLLPGWYMPAPMVGGRLLEGWRRRLALIVIVAFLAINAAGLCSTYGIVELAAGH
jgi:hypothetical protein